jgi:hypothetical protein
MKGYIYILQKKDRENTNVFKVGRTNDLKRRLSQYNKKNEMPLEMQEGDGDAEVRWMIVGSDEHLEWMETMNEEIKSKHQKMIDDGIVKNIKLVHSKEVEYEYVFTKKVNDCKWVESQLLEEMRFSWDDDGAWELFKPEWFICYDGWFEDTKRMIDRYAEIDKKRNRWMNDISLNKALWKAHHWEVLDRTPKKQNQIHQKLDTYNKINSAKNTSISNKTIKELSIGSIDRTPYLTE